MLSRILRENLRPYRRSVAAALVLLLGQAIANLYLPRLNADLINEGVAKGDTHRIWVIGGYMLAASTAVILASVEIVLVSLLATLFAIMYNLTVGLTGGFEVVLSDEA